MERVDINHNSEQCDRRWCNTSRNLAGSERAERMDATREHAARAAAIRSSNEHSATRSSDKAQRQLDACGASCCCQGESWSAGTLARPASGAAGHHCKHQLRHGLAALTCACTAGGRAMTWFKCATVACLASLASLDGRPDQVAEVCNMVARVDGVLSSQSRRECSCCIIGMDGTSYSASAHVFASRGLLAAPWADLGRTDDRVQL